VERAFKQFFFLNPVTIIPAGRLQEVQLGEENAITAAEVFPAAKH